MQYSIEFESMWSDDPRTEKFYRDTGRPISITLLISDAASERPPVVASVGYLERPTTGQRRVELYFEHPDFDLPEDFPRVYYDPAEAKAELREWVRMLNAGDTTQQAMFQEPWADYRRRKRHARQQKQLAGTEARLDRAEERMAEKDADVFKQGKLF